MTDTSPVCRFCGSDRLLPVLSLGATPLADRLLTADQLDKPELRAPLDLVFSADCVLVKITLSVAPKVCSATTIHAFPRSTRRSRSISGPARMNW